METQKNLEEKVFSFVKKNHMIDPGDGIVAGISGGADSVCLLFMLMKLRKNIPFRITVVHVNHGIRKNAWKDEAYVKELCREKGIDYYPIHADVPALSAAAGESCEETGRKVRYESFVKIAEETGSSKIAVAHNRNDCGETLLFHLFRGCGIRGLAGIRPIRKYQTKEGFSSEIIRPLLCLDRSEIEDYLRICGIAYCTDETNEEDHYTRNKIRHHILPYAEQEISAGSSAHLSQTAELLTEVSDYLDIQTEEAAGRCVTRDDGGYIIDMPIFQSLHPLIRKSLLHHMILSLTPHERDIAYVHVESVFSLAQRQGNAQIDLPFGIIVRRRYGELIIEKKTKQQDKEPMSEGKYVKSFPFQDNETGIYLVIVDRTEEIREIQDLICTDIGEEKIYNPIQKKYTKWFDYDKIEGTLMLRCRRQGDYITIYDRERGEVRKSLKQFFIDKKIPFEERDRILLLADGPHILWVVGYRISEHYKVRKNTSRILKAEVVSIPE